MDATELQALLHRQMPLSLAMGVRVHLDGSTGPKLTCSLTANRNHLGTAFGGSMAALMMLTCYCRLFLILKGQGEVVLKQCHLEYLLPVREDLSAVCPAPAPESVDPFLRTFERKGRARIALTCEVRLHSGQTAARMQGEFVAFLDKASQTSKLPKSICN